MVSILKWMAYSFGRVLFLHSDASLKSYYETSEACLLVFRKCAAIEMKLSFTGKAKLACFTENIQTKSILCTRTQGIHPPMIIKAYEHCSECFPDHAVSLYLCQLVWSVLATANVLAHQFELQTDSKTFRAHFETTRPWTL